MIETIVQTSEPVAILGGGDVTPADLAVALDVSGCIVAADGGANTAEAAGLSVAAVIGDMDSVSDDARAAFADVLHPVAEQDSTDFEKCLMRVSAPICLGVGFLGGRLDHQLAALHALMRYSEQPCVLIGGGDLVFLCPPSVHLDLPPGMPVSLFPLAPVTAQLHGLEWSFEALDLAPGERIGTSNKARGPVTLGSDAPGLLVILPSAALPEVMRQRPSAPSWSAVRV